MGGPAKEVDWRVQQKQIRKKELEEFVLGLFKKALGVLTGAIIEKEFLNDPRDFRKLELWDTLQDFEARKLIRYVEGENPGYRYCGPREIVAPEPIAEAPPPPPRVIRVPAPEPAKEPEVAKPAEEVVVRNLKNTTDEMIVEFIRDNSPSSGEVATWLNVSYPTAVRRLDVLKAKGLIGRKGPHSPWSTQVSTIARESGPVTRPDAISLSIPPAAQDPADVILSQDFGYKFTDDGGLVFTGLLHHRKIVIPPDEVVKIAEVLGMTPVDRAKKAVKFATPPQ